MSLAFLPLYSTLIAIYYLVTNGSFIGLALSNVLLHSTEAKQRVNQTETSVVYHQSIKLSYLCLCKSDELVHCPFIVALCA